MAEYKMPVRAVEVDYRCEKCSQGHMRPTGVKFLATSNRYEHRCSNCKETEVFEVNYPFIRHERQS